MTLFAIMIVFVMLPSFASQDLFIPKWFLVVYQYFKDEQISAKAFENAITYLQKVGVMRLSTDSQEDAITNFLMTNSIIGQNSSSRSEFSNCSPHWYITGYFTPVESDYAGKFITVNVDGATYQFREDFVTEIKTEGWGKALSGRYLGWYDESFHLSDFPLDATGNNLEPYMIAVDPSIIPQNSRLMIPTLVHTWDEVVFLASDVGTSIVGKHIDVYTGEGKDAHKETYRITGHENIVCLEVR